MGGIGLSKHNYCDLFGDNSAYPDEITHILTLSILVDDDSIKHSQYLLFFGQSISIVLTGVKSDRTKYQADYYRVSSLKPE